MSQDEVTKLFVYMQDFRGEMNSRFDDADKRFDDVYRQLDRQMKLMSDSHEELLALTGQVDRHDRWINQLTDKTDTKLTC